MLFRQTGNSHWLFSPFQYDSVHSECYGHHIFPAEAVELVARFFSVVFYL